jgi:fructose-bisphosphate aldolase class 1
VYCDFSANQCFLAVARRYFLLSNLSMMLAYDLDTVTFSKVIFGDVAPSASNEISYMTVKMDLTTRDIGVPKHIFLSAGSFKKKATEASNVIHTLSCRCSCGY